MSDKAEVIKLGAFRVHAFPGGKSVVYHKRKKLGVWWVSVPTYLLNTVGEDLKANAQTAINAALEQHPELKHPSQRQYKRRKLY